MKSAGLVLAAGSSRRMGRSKQLLPFNGRPLLEGVVAAANDSSLDEVLVVLGANAEEIERGVELGRARVVVNPDHEAGLGSSLRAGLSALGSEVGRAMVILVAQPAVRAKPFDRLRARPPSPGPPSAAPRCAPRLRPRVPHGTRPLPAPASLRVARAPHGAAGVCAG